MSWMAEIFRKDRLSCSGCGILPTHRYDPPPGTWPPADPEAPSASNPEEDPAGTRLCTACLSPRLEKDFAASAGRVLVFEPALGPDALVFYPIEGPATPDWLLPHASAVRMAISSAGSACGDCGGAGRHVWIPSPADANLWRDDWLPGLEQGSLRLDVTLCGACAARRLVRSIEERGLHYDAIIPPGSVDGVLLPVEG